MTNEYHREEEVDFKGLLKKTDDEVTFEESCGYFDPELLQFLSSHGDIDEWETIANKHGIFPQYLTDHMTDEQV